MAKIKENPVTIRIPESKEIKEDHNLHVYVADSTGKVIETTPIKGSTATLGVTKEKIKEGRVFIAPALPKELPAEKITSLTLASLGAYQVPINFSGDNINIPNLPSAIIRLPDFFWCHVTGNVTNKILVNGVSHTEPVCHARVHVCKVEKVFKWPFWIHPMLPDDILQDLKNRFAILRERDILPHVPDPGPLAHAQKAKLDLRSLTGVKAPVGPKPLPTDLHEAIQSATVESIYSLVDLHHEILYPHFCLWPPIWRWFYRVEEEVVVETDCNGHFDASLFRFPGWTENIYVWLEVYIGGVWVTVYRPPYVCYTHWGYACGTDINIALNDRRIPMCDCTSDIPDGSVLFTTIGHDAILHSVEQNPASTVSISRVGPGGLSYTHVIRNLGCTDLLDAHRICPFGGQLSLNLAFGKVLPSGEIIPGSGTKVSATHYRWRVSWVKDSSLADRTFPSFFLSDPQDRRYNYTDASGKYQSTSVQLKDTDDLGNNAYMIPIDSMRSGMDPKWDNAAFTSAVFNSASPSYQYWDGYTAKLDLELLIKDGGIFKVLTVDQGHAGFNTFQVSESRAHIFTSVPAGSDYITPAASGKATSLSFMIRTDNASVTANIDDIWLLDGPGGSMVRKSGPCGFIKFEDPNQYVRVRFEATETWKLARLTFMIQKGDSIHVPSAELSNEYIFSSAGVYTEAGGFFTADIKIADLLGTCDKGAFVATLYVNSLATNGSISTGSLSHLGPIDEAFALSNS